MRWILIVLGVVVGIVAIVAAIGAAVPKGHVAARRIRLARTPDEVWRALADFASHPSWRKNLKEMRRLPDRDGKPV